MKTLYSVVLLMLIAPLAQAQIPNASFEHWTGNAPTGWYVTIPSAVVQSTDSHDSTYAVRLNVVMSGNTAISGTLNSGDSGTAGNFPIHSIPDTLTGWYIAHTLNNDQLTITSRVSVNGVTVGQITTYFYGNTNVYKQFSYVYDTANVTAGADSANIQFGVANYTSGTLDTSTYYIIDDLSFSSVSVGAGIAQVNEAAVLEQCTPNPAGNMANIIYSINDHSTVSLTLYDLVGHKVMTLLDDLQQTPGRYKVPTDVSALPNGIYFYRLNVNGQSYTQKLVVSK